MLSLFTGVLAAQNNSQHADLTWGPIQPGDRNSVKEQFITYDETGFYTHHLDDNVNWMSHYTPDMNKEIELAFVFPFLYKLPVIQSYIHVNDELWVVFSDTDKKAGEYHLYIQEIDKERLKLQGEAIHVGVITGIDVNTKYNSYLETKLSSDSSKLLIMYTMPLSSNNYYRNKVHVFNTAKMELFWENEIEFNKDELFLVMLEKYVANNGDIITLARETKLENIKTTNGFGLGSFYLLRFTSLGYNYLKLNLEDKHIDDIKIMLHRSGVVFGNGFYSDKLSGGAKGTFYIVIDSKHKAIINKQFYQFNMEFIKKNMNEVELAKLKKAKEKGFDSKLYDYKVDHLLMVNDTCMIMVAEQYHVEERKQDYIWNYNDIIIMKTSLQGQIGWVQKIPLRQIIYFGNASWGYNVRWNDNKLFLTYNDNPRNFENTFNTTINREKGNFFPYQEGGSVLALTTVDLYNGGKYVIEPLWHSKDVGNTVFPKGSAMLLENNSMMYFISGNKGTHRYVKLNFK